LMIVNPYITFLPTYCRFAYAVKGLAGTMQLSSVSTKVVALMLCSNKAEQSRITANGTSPQLEGMTQSHASLRVILDFQCRV
jgi:hypothetical protein